MQNASPDKIITRKGTKYRNGNAKKEKFVFCGCHWQRLLAIKNLPNSVAFLFVVVAHYCCFWAIDLI